MREILQMSHHRNYCIDRNQILHRDKDHQVGLLFVGGPNKPQINLRWRTAAVFKNRKTAIFQKLFNPFCQKNNSNFKNPRWQTAAILKMENRHLA